MVVGHYRYKVNKKCTGRYFLTFNFLILFIRLTLCNAILRLLLNGLNPPIIMTLLCSPDGGVDRSLSNTPKLYTPIWDTSHVIVGGFNKDAAIGRQYWYPTSSHTHNGIVCVCDSLCASIHLLSLNLVHCWWMALFMALNPCLTPAPHW